MNHRSHRNLAKLFSPGTPYKVIDDVNSIIDNPNQMSILFNQVFQRNQPDPRTGELKMTNPYDFYGLGKTASHRRVNHDVLSATAMCFKAHGIEGAKLGNLHCYADMFGEELKKRHGTTGRDLFEAHMNHMLENSVLPTIIENRKMMGYLTRGAYESAKRSYHSSSSRRIAHRQNLHRTFIPTKAFYR